MKKYITPIICFLIILVCFIGFLIESSRKEEKLQKLTVAEVTHSVFYAPAYAAISNGYFKEEGLDIELILTPGADKVMAAVLSGDADIGLSGSEATIYIYNSGEKDYIKTFAQLTRKDGSFIISRKNIENFTLDDLKGKYVIGGRTAGMPLMMLQYSLRHHNIDPDKDLTIDTSIEFASMSSAFIGGTGDFVNLFEPLATQVVNQGYGYKVASLGDFGGIVPYTAYNARSSFIENNKDVIKKFTSAIQKGLDFTNNNSSETVAQAILDFFPDTSLKDLTQAVESYKKNETWPTTTTFTKESFDHLQDIIVEANIIKEEEKVDYKDLVYVP